MRGRAIAAFMVVVLSFGSAQAFAATPKAGVACTKIGLKSGSLICAKTNGIFKWQILKKTQRISYSAPRNASIIDLSVKFNYLATSELTVSLKNLTPNICTLGVKELKPTGTAGLCAVSLSQKGNSFYLAAERITIKVTILGTNVINFQLPESISMSQNSFSLVATSSSGLAVTFTSITTDVCSTANSILTLISAGKCTVLANQEGGNFIPAAAPSTQSTQISLVASTLKFELPAALLLSQGTYLLVATSNSNLPITFSSLTTDVCAVSTNTLTLLKAGTCQVSASQVGSNIYAATLITGSAEISASRVQADLPDTVSGFQVKAIYVVPSDGVDNSKDTNGYLARVLQDGNTYLKGQLNLTLPIDKSSVGYDIQYLKSSYSTEYLRTHANSSPNESSDGYVLLREIKAMENPGNNRKDYIFFIEVPGFDETFCGFANRPGFYSVVALQNTVGNGICTGKSSPYFNDYVTTTWVHEIFHNFGVKHTVDDPCDLMAGKPETLGTCTSGGRYTLDKERTRYVGASIQGADILKMRVWEGYTDNAGLVADCFINPVTRTDGIDYAYCPTGTRTIGALRYCWSSITSISLEEYSEGAWKSLGTGSHYNQFWGGALAGWKCSDLNYTAPWKEVTVLTPGLRHYRWVVNGSVSEETNILWVK